MMSFGSMSFDQYGIMALGVTAVMLSQDKREGVRKFACLFGMCSQPFWFIAAWKAEQLGVLLVCCFYTVAWARGIWNFWVAPRFA